ncbi:FUSC family protein [Pseudonocardia alaniniphila]|uniref:FUSC family protein n=1 Tax=Pseudonocardia alaniniphila TaxID=75291 RepID=A0ABS9TRJ0_9PSEU|nr:FUSC family protein [Pseudonocardia alaniniphila]MCH6171167.1 FUSC family protein [Pseudonocardia alaniniphila]
MNVATLRGLLPDWFIRTIAFGSAPAPWRDSVRSAVTVPAVAGVGYAIGGPGTALISSLSALLVVLSERSGTTGQRTLRSACALAGGTLAMVFGPATGGTGFAPLLVVLTFGLVSGLLSALGSGLSFAGMQLLVQMAVAGGVQIDISTTTRVTAYVLGGLTAISGMWLQSALERTDRLYATALSQAVRALGAYANSPAGGDASELRRAMETTLAAAAQLILTARPIRRARRAKLALYRSVLARVSVLVTVVRSRSVDARTAEALRAYAEEIAAITPSTRVEPHLTAPVAALLPATSLEPPRPVPVRRIVSAQLGHRRSWQFVARLLLCLLVAEFLRQITPFGHSYWIVLTVALCLKPDFASVFSRTLQRGIGTGLGVVIGWGATFFAAGYSVLPILAVLCAAIPWAVRRNYWAFSVIITPLVLLLLDYGGTVAPDVLLQRLVNTATGCTVVLVVGYALVPGTWWPPVDRERERVEADLARVTTTQPIASLVDRSLQRAAIASTLQAMRDRAAQANSEPRPIRVRALRWARVATCLEDRLMSASEPLTGGTTPHCSAPVAECLPRPGDGLEA